MFRLQIDTSNAAFDPPGPELARILRTVADRFEAGDIDHQSTALFDSNGNFVGGYQLSEGMTS